MAYDKKDLTPEEQNKSAKVFNLKQMAAALACLQGNGLTEYEQLEKKAGEATERFHVLTGK